MGRFMIIDKNDNAQAVSAMDHQPTIGADAPRQPLQGLSAPHSARSAEKAT